LNYAIGNQTQESPRQETYAEKHDTECAIVVQNAEDTEIRRLHLSWRRHPDTWDLELQARKINVFGLTFTTTFSTVVTLVDLTLLNFSIFTPELKLAFSRRI
jgi:hypothetical protein